MNSIYSRLNKPRIVSYKNTLVGQPVPVRSKDNSGNTGISIDYLVKSLAGSDTRLGGTVDIEQLGIEVKAKDIHTNTNWSIGSMTAEDIINTDYINSPIYQKMQALFLVRYDNDLGLITKTDLCYFDNDEVQSRICRAYESARNKIAEYVGDAKVKLNDQLFIFETPKVKFTSYQKFKGTDGYCFEYMNSGTSFNFRISIKEMQDLVNTAYSINNPLFDFS